MVPSVGLQSVIMTFPGHIWFYCNTIEMLDKHRDKMMLVLGMGGQGFPSEMSFNSLPTSVICL